MRVFLRPMGSMSVEALWLEGACGSQLRLFLRAWSCVAIVKVEVSLLGNRFEPESAEDRNNGGGSSFTTKNSRFKWVK